jgi:hypothetical protein
MRRDARLAIWCVSGKKSNKEYEPMTTSLEQIQGGHTMNDKQFLEAFTGLFLDWLKSYRAQDDPDDPHFFGRSGLRDMIVDILLVRHPEFAPVFAERSPELTEALDDISQMLYSTAKAHFYKAGFDYANIPLAPDIDHDKKRSVHNEAGKILRNTRRYGQVVVSGSRSRYNGWAEMVIPVQGVRYCRVARWHPAYSGYNNWRPDYNDLVEALAPKVSRLTDWSLFPQQPRKVKRAIETKLRGVLETNTSLDGLMHLG